MIRNKPARGKAEVFFIETLRPQAAFLRFSNRGQFLNL